MSRLERLITKTLIAGAFLFGLGGCGDTIVKSNACPEIDVQQQEVITKYKDSSAKEDMAADLLLDNLSNEDLSAGYCSGELKDNLLEGETKSYLMNNGNKYEIGLLFTDGEFCKFIVNGEETDKLKEKESYAYADGATICVQEILYQAYAGGMHRCNFAFSGGEKINVPIDVISETDVFDTPSEDDIQVEDSKLSINGDYECGDFSWYPDSFQIGGVFNGYFIVGANASAYDNLAMTDIALSMQYTNANGELEYFQFVNATKLDNEIADIGAQNLITIGNPCVNTVTAALLGNPANCTNGFSPGTAKVMILKNKDTGNLAMIVAGYSGEDTRLAGKVIANNWKKIQENGGCELEIEGTTY